MFLSSLPGYKSPMGVIRGKASLTLAEFDGLLRTFLLEVYHRREDSETNIPPAERWEKGGFLPHMPDSLEQLDLLLFTVSKARKVRPDGIHLPRLALRGRAGDVALRSEW
jgi:putative transposase